MFKDKNKTLFYSISLAFIAINLVFAAFDFYYFALLPVLLLFVFVSIVSLDKLFLSIVFFTPLSIQLDDLIPGIPLNLSLPTEPLLIGLLFLFIFKLLLDGKFDKKIILHPVSIAIYINLLCLFITSLTSTMPGVSFKFLISRIWFVVGMYFLATQVFKNFKNQKRFIFLYIISLIVVIIYTNYQLSQHGFDNQKASNWVVWPFFSDHTSYGAMLVMFIFPVFYFVIQKGDRLIHKLSFRAVFLIFVLAIVFSYTRAAWLSLFAGIGLWLIIKLKFRIRTLVLGGIILVVFAFLFVSTIFKNLEKNQAESSGKFSEHIGSIANISTDASNVERLNRWKCAIAMFKEKPFFGWGPGTYSFKYAPFQMSYNKSVISTNFGDLGNAHSEYLGPLSESGIIGLLSFLMIVFFAFRTAYRVYHQTEYEHIKEYVLYITLGLFTYFIHGILNNFLDTDKASVPVWGFIAMIVAMDVFTTPKELNSQ